MAPVAVIGQHRGSTATCITFWQLGHRTFVPARKSGVRMHAAQWGHLVEIGMTLLLRAAAQDRLGAILHLAREDASIFPWRSIRTSRLAEITSSSARPN